MFKLLEKQIKIIQKLKWTAMLILKLKYKIYSFRKWAPEALFILGKSNSTYVSFKDEMNEKMSRRK